MKKKEFDSGIALYNDPKFQKWITDDCVWVETSLENMYFFLPLNWKFHSPERLYNYYQKYHQPDS